MPFIYFLTSGNFSNVVLEALNQNKYQFLKTFGINGTDMDTIGKQIIFNGNATTTPNGKFGQALIFDGSVGTFVETNPSGSRLGIEDFSIYFWINPTNITGLKTILASQGYETAISGSWKILLNNTAIEFSWYNGALETAVLTTGNLTASAFSHVLVTRRNGVLYVYINGVLSSNTVFSDDLIDDSGFDISANTNVFNGVIDDINVIPGVSLIGDNDPTVPFLAPDSETHPPIDYDPTLNNIEFLLTAKHITDYSGDISNLQFDDLFKQSFFSSTGITLSDTREFFTGERVIDVAGSVSSMQFDGTFADLGTEDFTIECFVEADTLQSQDVFFLSKYNTSGNQRAWGLGRRLSDNKFLFRWSLDGSSIIEIISDGTVSTGTSYHVAVTREDTTLTLFIDGVPQTNTGIISGAMFGGTANFLVGGIQDGVGNSLEGAIDQIRIIKGEAIYRSTGFTPPQTPLYNPQKEPVGTDRSRTVFWLDADDYTDITGVTNDKLGLAVTQINMPALVSVQSPYHTQAFEGDQLTTPARRLQVTPPFDLHINDWTLECWYYRFVTLNQLEPFLAHWSTIGGALGATFVWQIGVSGTMQVLSQDSGNSVPIDVARPTDEQWHHLALTWNATSTTFELFIDGVSVTTSGAVTQDTAFSNAAPLEILGYQDNTSFFGSNIRLSEIKLHQGLVKYDDNFSTYPDNPLETNHYSTDLLIQADDTYGTGFNWDRTGSGLESTNTTITTDSDFFYGKKIEFNGTDSIITVNDKPVDYNGDFAIEAEIEPNTLTGNKDILEGGNYLLTLNGSTLQFESPIATPLISTTITSGRSRIFFGRKGGDLQLAIDGVFVNPVTNIVTLQHQTDLEIGGGNNNPFDGGISSFRMKHSYIEPAWNPPQPPPIANDPYINNVTFLLTGIGLNGATGISAFPELRETTPTFSDASSTQISNSNPNFNNSSILFDGDRDWLLYSNTVPNLLERDFSLEFWFRPDSVPGSGFGKTLIDFRPLSTNGNYLSLDYGGSLGTTLRYNQQSSPQITSTTNIIANTWYHIMISRKDLTVYLFINGLLQGSSLQPGYLNSNRFLIGGNAFEQNTSTGSGATTHFDGRVQWVRITDGICRATESFPIPTQPFPLI